MARPRFIHNLRAETFTDEYVKALSPHGYLLAPNNATATLREFARTVRTGRRRLLIDNGKFVAIGRVSGLFAAEAKQLTDEVAALEAQLGRSLRSVDVPPALRADFRALSDRVRGHIRAESQDDASPLAAQLALNPTHLIGVEDITIATWLSLSLEPVYTGRDRADYRRYNRAVARRAVAQLQSLSNELRATYYPVASAISYNTARDAGQVFGEAGIERVAMGFGAYMADDNSTDHVKVGRRELRFPSRLPTRYVRTAAVAKAFYDGYRDATGRAPEGFHFLGLGAPIMIAIVTLCAQETESLTFDATSPIKDATQGGTLYVTKPAYLKIRTRKAARRLASDNSQTWACPCPFCAAFVVAHPFRYEIGHRWFMRESGREVNTADLQPGGDLFDAYPLLSEPRSGVLRDDVDAARIGHNHWALEKMTAALRRASSSGRLTDHVERVVAAYTPKTTAPFASAVRFSLVVARDGLT